MRAIWHPADAISAICPVINFLHFTSTVVNVLMLYQWLFCVPVDVSERLCPSRCVSVFVSFVLCVGARLVGLGP